MRENSLVPLIEPLIALVTWLRWIAVFAVAGFLAWCSWPQSAPARDLGQWAQSSPERRQWFRSLTIPEKARPRLRVPYIQCCDDGDRVKTRFRVQKTSGADQWSFLDPLDDIWKIIPPDIVIHDKQSPDGEAYLFRSAADNATLLCFVPPLGGI